MNSINLKRSLAAAVLTTVAITALGGQAPSNATAKSQPVLTPHSANLVGMHKLVMPSKAGGGEVSYKGKCAEGFTAALPRPTALVHSGGAEGMWPRHEGGDSVRYVNAGDREFASVRVAASGEHFNVKYYIKPGVQQRKLSVWIKCDANGLKGSIMSLETTQLVTTARLGKLEREAKELAARVKAVEGAPAPEVEGKPFAYDAKTTVPPTGAVTTVAVDCPDGKSLDGGAWLTHNLQSSDWSLLTYKTPTGEKTGTGWKWEVANTGEESVEMTASASCK